LGDRSLEIGPDGLSTAKAVQPDSIASVQREFPGPLARIGVTAAFPAVSPDSKALETGDLILRVSTGPLTASNGADRTQTAPNSGIVFSFGARHWYIGIQDGDKPAEVLHSGSFEPALYGRRSVDVIRWKEQVRIELPDGSAKLISDPRIADWSGPWASWGLRQGPQANRTAAINQLLAGW
jgi:hypothetical protein